MAQDALTARLKNHEDNFVERKPEGVNSAEIRQGVIEVGSDADPVNFDLIIPREIKDKIHDLDDCWIL
jgi:hypothetical protein